MYICQAGIFPLGKRILNVRSMSHPAAWGLTTGIFGSWCTFEREEGTLQRSAEYGLCGI